MFTSESADHPNVDFVSRYFVELGPAHNNTLLNQPLPHGCQSVMARCQAAECFGNERCDDGMA
jgi:hypothetical protein